MGYPSLLIIAAGRDDVQNHKDGVIAEHRHRGMHVREGHETFEEATRRVYWDMAIYDKEAMELLIKRVGVDNVLFATGMFGAINAIDPKTGRNLEDIVPIFQSID